MFSQKRFPILIFSIVGFCLFLFFVVGYFTFLDSEWQDWQILNQIRKNHDLLQSYKKTYSRYPDSLDQAGSKDRYCLVLKCFEIKYKPSANRQTYTSAAKANSPFIIYWRSQYEYGIGFEEDYKGDRTDRPIYLKNNKQFSNPSEWPSL